MGLITPGLVDAPRVLSRVGGRSDMPTCPVEISDAVEKYARKSDRHATCVCVPTEFDYNGRIVKTTWRVDLSLRPGDPLLKAYQKGRTKKVPCEEIWLHRLNPEPAGWRDKYIPFKIEDMGASGVVEFLEQGNIHSGRGEFNSMDDVVTRTAELNAQRKQKRFNDGEDRVRAEARDKRRSRLKIPFLGVGVDLKETD